MRRYYKHMRQSVVKAMNREMFSFQIDWQNGSFSIIIEPVFKGLCEKNFSLEGNVTHTIKRHLFCDSIIPQTQTLAYRWT